jgi:hypothetical protein
MLEGKSSADSYTYHALSDKSLQETVDGVINLEDDHPAAIDVMIAVIYNNGVYTIADYDPPVLVSEMYLHLYNMADKYSMDALAKLASDCFKARVAEDVLHARFHEVIRELYENSPDDSVTLDFKALVVDLCAVYRYFLTQHLEYVNFRVLMDDNLLFAVAFQQAVIVKETEDQLAILDAHAASPRRPEVRVLCRNPTCKGSFVMEWIGGWSSRVYYCPYCANGFTRTTSCG